MRSERGESVEVEYTPEFKRNLRMLAKKYRHICADMQPVIDQLQAGEVIGDQIPKTRHSIFKVRVKNSELSLFNSRIFSSCRYRGWLYGRSSLLIAVGTLVLQSRMIAC